MPRFHALAFLFAVLLALAGGAALAATVPIGDKPTCKPAQVPVLFFSQSGGFAAVASELSLKVYSQGSPTLTRLDADHPAGKACTKTVRPERLARLTSDLQKAGGFVLLSNRKGEGTDLPLITVTFFIQRQTCGRSLANTFTYYSTSGAYAAVDKVIRAFIAEVFPGC